MNGPETSIIIRTFNEERYLPGLMEAIQKQRYRDFEVINVDSGSYDRTTEIIRQYDCKLLNISSQDFTFGYSLNVGIEAAAGQFVVIVSAHTKPINDQWLERLVEPLRQEPVAMVYGRQSGVASSKYGEVRDMERTFGPERRVLKPPLYIANNANSALLRALWEQHPFDESLPGQEDVEWAKFWMEKGYQVVYEPEAAIYHIHNETWQQLWRRYYREALADRYIGIKGRQNIPLEIVREGKYLLVDLVKGGVGNNIGQRSRDIVLFRVNKTLGTVQGLWDGAAIEDPRRRHELFFDSTGRAVVIHGPHSAAFQESVIPAVKPGDVVIKVAYVGVCATDLDIFDGTLGYYKSGQAKYPIIPGHEFSGKVVKVGPNITHLLPGDPVVAECIQSCGECTACQRENWTGCRQRKEVGVIGRNGAYAEYVVMRGQFVHKLGDDLGLKQACLCEPLAVVLKGVRSLEHILETGGAKRCAVVGAGPIGHLCALILASRGHHVTVFDRDPRRRSYLDENSPAISTSTDLESLSDFQVLIEATGDPEALELMLAKSSAGSALLLLGLPYAKREFTFESVVADDKTIIGSVGSTAKDFKEAIALLPRLDVRRFTEKTLPLGEFQAAWELCRSITHLKVLLEVEP